MEIGKKLKEIRKAKKITLQELSVRTDLSVSFLSNIERDVNSPTLVNFNRITEALGTTIVDFLSDHLKSTKILTKRDEFEEVLNIKSGIKFELTLCGEKGYKCFCMTIAANYHTEEDSLGLPEDNFALVVQGALKLEIYGQTYEAAVNDVLFIPGSTPHSYSNISDQDSIIYWFAVTPSVNESL
ncbi:MAG: XRE family transcriptional regulator [Clostridia bacterium]